MNYFNTEDLLAMFAQSGDAELIANDFTRALNEAVKIQKQKEQEEAEKRAAEAKRKAEEERKAAAAKEKFADTKFLIDTFINFGEKYYPTVFAGVRDEEIDVQAVIDAMDASASIVALTPMVSFIDNDKFTKPINEKKVNEDPLTKFLKSEGLI